MTRLKQHLLSFQLTGTVSRPHVRYALAFLAGCVCTLLQRDLWCQSRGYAVLLALGGAFIVATRAHARRNQRRVRINNGAHCVECGKAGKACIQFGKDEEHERPTSYYEAVYGKEPASALLLLFWAVWVMYSALFHEGNHEAAEDGLIESWASAIWRVWRVWALFGCALASLVLDGEGQFRKRWVAALLLLAAAPQERATVANMDGWQIVAQTSLYTVAYLASEALEAVHQYLQRAKQVGHGGSTVFWALLMAQGKADIVRLKPVTATHFLVQKRAGERTHALSSRIVLERLLSAMRAGWILLAGPGLGAWLGVLFVAVEVLSLLFYWRRVERLVETKEESAEAGNAVALVRSGDPLHSEDKHREPVEEAATPRVTFVDSTSNPLPSSSSLRQRRTPPPPKSRRPKRPKTRRKEETPLESSATSSESTTNTSEALELLGPESGSSAFVGKQKAKNN